MADASRDSDSQRTDRNDVIDPLDHVPPDYAAFAKTLHKSRRTDRRCVVTLSSVPSTHHLLRRLIGEYSRDAVLPPRCDLVAWAQTGGVGRHDRPWFSPAGGGAWISAARPVDAAALQTLPLLVAVAIGDVLNRHLDGRCRLKWPNDLLVDTRKIAGILIDTTSREGADPVAILSFGINVDADLSRFSTPTATSLGHELAPEAPPALADFAIEALESLDARLAAPGDLVGAYRKLLAHRPGDSLRCLLADGEEVEGTFVDIDDRGHLVLDSGDGPRTLAVAEVMGG